MYALDPSIDNYSARYSSNEPEHLQQLSRITHLRTMQPRMLSGHVQGRFLAMISQMIRPQYILEIGTFTGYSAICLAEGLADHGKLITIEVNEELKSIAQEAFHSAGIQHRIDPIIGDAAQIIPTLNQIFDLIFIDADKRNYIQYYELTLPLLRTGGFLIADNVLWSGQVLNEKFQDTDTQALRDFVAYIHEDTRVENILLTVRDGLMVVRKK
jgi:predicted O-methyltransferase YrrM